MKQLSIGLFATRREAEKAISHIHQELSVPTSEISFLYRNTDGAVTEVDADSATPDTPLEGAEKGAWIGGAAGAIAGIATVIGIIPVIGPIFAAGPIVSALGIGAGAVGTTAAGALTGAATGGLVGALVNLGVSEPQAQHYEDRVVAGDVLVTVHADAETDIASALSTHGATDVNVYTPTV